MCNHQHYGEFSSEDGGSRRRRLHHRRTGTGSKSSSSKLSSRPQLLRLEVSYSKYKDHHDGGTSSLSPWLSRQKRNTLCAVTSLKKLKRLHLIIIIAGMMIILSIRLARSIHSTHDADVDTNLLSTVFQMYMSSLSSYPLITKMTTGAALATAGDALAQWREDDDYDPSRGASFAAFDSIYRVVQHWVFPSIVKLCRGQYLLVVAGAIGAGRLCAKNLSILASMERSLASQLIMVPFLYYPLFFTFTGYMQRLNFEEGLDRAKLNFVPLMKRNLLFGIPVQFVQFFYVPTELQIPFLSLAGIAWTFLLSAHAGSTKKRSTNEPDLGRCCVIEL